MVATHRSSDTPAGSMSEFPPGFRSLADLCRRLDEICPGWLTARFAETDVIAALPRFHDQVGGLREIWRAALPPALTPSELQAEAELSDACAGGNWLGISRQSFVDFQFSRCKNASPADPFGAWLPSMLALGWKSRHLHQVRRITETVDDLHDRTIGAAGWLISHTAFREQRDALRSEWQALPDQQRPPLPLLRSVKLESPPADTSRQRPSRLTDFWRSFNAFCDTWRLLGMVTWDLPNTDGPKWSEAYPGQPAGLNGVETLDTPWHFPVDGQVGLGRMLEERHRQRATDRGFVDQRRWETYAHFLTIDFWERVLRSRYADRERPKAKVSRVLAVLAELTGCDNERVKKLRHTLLAFQRGERTSLQGSR